MKFDQPKLSTAKPLDKLRSYENEIEDEKQEKAFQWAIEATNKVVESDGAKLSESLSHLDRSDRIVEYNFETLESVFNRAEDISGYSWEEVKDLYEEFLVHFSNFVVTAKSRENITRDTVLPELEKFHILSSITDDYNDKVSEFSVDLHGYFFTSLRNYLVHEGVPESVLVLGRVKDEPEKDQFTISKKHLEESDNFSAEARGYMDTWEDTIDVVEASRDYYNLTRKLYDWLFEYTKSLYSSEFSESEFLDERARRRQEVFFNLIDQSFMKIEWKKADQS